MRVVLCIVSVAVSLDINVYLNLCRLRKVAPLFIRHVPSSVLLLTYSYHFSLFPRYIDVLVFHNLLVTPTYTVVSSSHACPVSFKYLSLGPCLWFCLLSHIPLSSIIFLQDSKYSVTSNSLSPLVITSSINIIDFGTSFPPFPVRT